MQLLIYFSISKIDEFKKTKSIIDITKLFCMRYLVIFNNYKKPMPLYIFNLL